MLYARDFDDKVIFCGAEASPAKVSDVTYKELTTGSAILAYTIDVAGRLTGAHIDDGTENIPPNKVQVEEFIPEDLTEKTKKSVARFNRVIAKLTGATIDPEDLTAWQRLMPGGDLHDKVIGAEVYVEVNDWQGRKKFQFNNDCTNGPVRTFEQVKVLWANKQARKKEKEAEVAALGI